MLVYANIRKKGFLAVNRLSRIPVRVGWRTVTVDGVRVRMKLIRQFGQFYALGKDASGTERAGIGETTKKACENLAGMIRFVNKHQRTR